MCGQGTGQSREKSKPWPLYPGILLNTGADQEHFNKNSHLLPNGKSALLTLLPHELVFQLASDWICLWNILKGNQYVGSDNNLHAQETMKKGYAFCSFKTTEFELTQVALKIWASVSEHSGE